MEQGNKYNIREQRTTGEQANLFQQSKGSPTLVGPHWCSLQNPKQIAEYTRNLDLYFFLYNELKCPFIMVIDCLPFMGHILELSVRGSPNDTIGNFTNGTIGSQGLSNGTIGLPLAPIVQLGESMVPLALPITIGTIGKTLNDICNTIGTIWKPRTHTLFLNKMAVNNQIFQHLIDNHFKKHLICNYIEKAHSLAVNEHLIWYDFLLFWYMLWEIILSQNLQTFYLFYF